VVWSRHPAQRLTLPAFAKMQHVLVAPRERAGGIVDSVLEKNGLSRRVVVQAPIVPIMRLASAETRHAAAFSVLDGNRDESLSKIEREMSNQTG